MKRMELAAQRVLACCLIALAIAISVPSCQATQGAAYNAASSATSAEVTTPLDGQNNAPFATNEIELVETDEVRKDAIVTPLDAQVAAKISSMTVEQKVAQLFIVRPEAIGPLDNVTVADDAVREYLIARPVAGFCFFAYNLQNEDQTRAMLAAFADYSNEASGLPPFLAVDEEGGTVSRVGANPGFPNDQDPGDMNVVGSTGDPQVARDAALQVAGYLKPLGFNVNFAPDADIYNGAAAVAQRSFGSSSETVSPMVAAQVDAYREAGLLCATKHFPGIGSTTGDSHVEDIVTEATLDEMRDFELAPFKAAIEHDVPFIMTGHVLTPAVTSDGLPASLSRQWITDILRNELGYQGIIITDSLGMGAATGVYSPDRIGVEAFLAGADILLMPADFEATYQSMIAAVNSGEISEERLDESVSRVVKTKLQMIGE